jgi:hypothetical protein
MGLISARLWLSLGLRGRLQPTVKPRGRGRPPKLKITRSIIEQAMEPRVDRRRTQGDTTWVVALVDKRKATLALEQRRSVSDREALAHLLYEGAPPDVRRSLEAALRQFQQKADTKHQQQRALTKAVELVEGDRLAWWVKRLSYHRTLTSRTASLAHRKTRRNTVSSARNAT